MANVEGVDGLGRQRVARQLPVLLITIIIHSVSQPLLERSKSTKGE